MFYPVRINYVQNGPLKGLAWLPPSVFLETLARMNDLCHILGGFRNMEEARPILTTFWDRYRIFFPHHELWNDIDAGRKQASQCIPLYLHGDEGTTYKRQGVLIVSWQSPLGYGSSRRPHHMAVNLADMGEAGLPLNFLKSGTFTRMLTIITPKDWV